MLKLVEVKQMMNKTDLSIMQIINSGKQKYFRNRLESETGIL